LEDNSEPHDFAYSGSGDVSRAVHDFVEANDIDENMAMPIQLAVEAHLEEDSYTKWEVTSSHLKGDLMEAIYRTSGSRKSLHSPSTNNNEPSWTHGDSCHEVNYDHSTTALTVKFQKALPVAAQPEERFEDLSADWRKFDPAMFLKLALKTALANAGASLLTHVAEKIASATLVTVAQMLHVNSSRCRCDPDDVFEEEAYQLELRQQLMKVVPVSEIAKARIHRLRARYAFALLESAMDTFEKPADQLLTYLKQDDRSRRAAECIISSMDQISDCHERFIGDWANRIVSELARTVSPSVDTAFIGRVGNPGRRSPTTEIDGNGADKEASSDKTTEPSSDKTKAPKTAKGTVLLSFSL
jgi:hypothetical protein